jgi:hypothetical protein
MTLHRSHLALMKFPGYFSLCCWVTYRPSIIPFQYPCSKFLQICTHSHPLDSQPHQSPLLPVSHWLWRFAPKLPHQFCHVCLQIPISGLQKLAISTNRLNSLQSTVFLHHEVIYVYWFKNHTPDFNFPLLVMLINQVNTLRWARQCHSIPW